MKEVILDTSHLYKPLDLSTQIAYKLTPINRNEDICAKSVVLWKIWVIFLKISQNELPEDYQFQRYFTRKNSENLPLKALQDNMVTLNEEHFHNITENKIRLWITFSASPCLFIFLLVFRLKA